jgi:hypothetical protein
MLLTFYLVYGEQSLLLMSVNFLLSGRSGRPPCRPLVKLLELNAIASYGPVLVVVQVDIHP